MDDTFSSILINKLKQLVPLICTILLILLAGVPLRLPFLKFLRADIGMICIYFWSLYRRDLLGPVSVAIIGFVVDSLGAVPLGVNMFIFILVYVLAITYGSFVNTKPFIVSWLGFAAISVIGFFTKWLLMSVYYSNFLLFAGIFAGLLSTILLYPLIARLNVFIQNKFLANEEVIYE